MNILRFACLVWLTMWAGVCPAQSLYMEEYRPQFHFSPKSGWIGDPDGLVKFQNKYHLFWWGHAESSDLVHWNEKVYPMRGDDGSFSYYTGSVVVDKNNSSGFGDGSKPPMVAIYTAHHKTTGIQDQRISYSTDYELFHYYSANPVLNINSTEFRDPDVFWYAPSGKWIMGITLPLERKIDLYSSDDLKSWQYLSSFGPIGAQEQVWEVPQLLHLPVDGSSDNRKWVMICSMGPNKMQYFPGVFDGTTFMLDDNTRNYLEKGVGIEGELFESFENGYGSWTVEGTAFGEVPPTGTLPDQGRVSGFLGNALVNTYNNGDGATGKLTSTSFLIGKKHINFLIGGGNNSGSLSINLVVNGTVVRSATGHNSEALKWKGWDVSELIGKEGRLVILDQHTGGWGHINVDHIMFSDVSMNYDREHAYWIDYGPDFYAGRAYRDYDDDLPAPVVWLGWMGNWEYANQTPTTWGRGAQSIPRELEFRTTSGSPQICQKPIPALQQLRGDVTSVGPKVITGTHTLAEFPVRRNTYEIEATFELTGGPQNFGLNLFKSAAGKVVLGYDGKTSMIYLDRRFAGNSSFSPLFPKINYAPLKSNGTTLKLHVFVDQSSVEVFVNDGEVVMTSLVFPYAGSTAVEVFSNNGSVNLQHLDAWELASIWGIEPPGPVTSISEKPNASVNVYPNPSTKGQDTIIIELNDATVAEQVLLTLLDSRGSKVYEKQIRLEHGKVGIPGMFPSGLYHVKVTTKGKVFTEKLIIR